MNTVDDGSEGVEDVTHTLESDSSGVRSDSRECCSNVGERTSVSVVSLGCLGSEGSGHGGREFLKVDLTLGHHLTDFFFRNIEVLCEGSCGVDSSGTDRVELGGEDSSVTSDSGEDASDVVKLSRRHCCHTDDTSQGCLKLLDRDTRSSELSGSLGRLIQSVGRSKHRSVCSFHNLLDLSLGLHDTTEHEVGLLEVSGSGHTTSLDLPKSVVVETLNTLQSLLDTLRRQTTKCDGSNVAQREEGTFDSLNFRADSTQVHPIG